MSAGNRARGCLCNARCGVATTPGESEHSSLHCNGRHKAAEAPSAPRDRHMHADTSSAALGVIRKCTPNPQHSPGLTSALISVLQHSMRGA